MTECKMKNKIKLNEWSFIKNCFSNAPMWSFFVFIMNLLKCFVPYIKVVVFAKFVDTALLVITQNASIKTAVYQIILVLLVVGYSKMESSLSAIAWLKIDMGLRQGYVIEQLTKIASLEYRHIENADTLSLIHRTNKKSEERVRNTYQVLLEALTLLAQVISIFFIIAKVSFITGIAVMVLSVPLFFLAMKAGKRNYDVEQEVTSAQRRYEYFNKINSQRDNVDERSLFEYSNLINEKWTSNYERYRKKKNWATLLNNFHLESSSIITSLLTIIISAFLLIPFFDNKLSIGLYMSLFAAVIELVETMSWTFTGIISGITENHQYIKDVNSFFSLSEESDGVLDMPEDREGLSRIEFKNVKFKYPQMDYYILNGVSFLIEKGKHYAFVGSNGAGKSTIIKLLTGLYREYEGEILLDGKELRQYKISELKGFLSTVYQDFAKYAVTMKDNLWFGNMNCDNERLQTVIEQIGLKDVIKKLPDGWDTPLGRIEEKSVDLSGGEWQRIAIARSLLSENKIQILDEPTAALDPIMENKMYEEFSNASKDKTTIFISHRLGSTKLADIIFVIEDGVIAESGTHEMLMEQKTIYRKMFESQRKWYES